MTDNMVSQKGNFQTSTGSLMTVNFILTVVMSSSLGSLWNLINTFQILAYISVINIQFPSNSNYIVRHIVEVVDFDIFPSDLLALFFFRFNWYQALPSTSF
jgi:hypothetical protein